MGVKEGTGLKSSKSQNAHLRPILRPHTKLQLPSRIGWMGELSKKQTRKIKIPQYLSSKGWNGPEKTKFPKGTIL